MEAPEVYEIRRIHDHNGVKYVSVPSLFLETMARIWNMDIGQVKGSKVIWSVNPDGSPNIEIIKPRMK